ncbi:AfsR/SARP family transcriptional regulator [Streptomyces sp. NPDC051172]|uniref:AfsR/SARP family transcriptional regulator n=1 Tax=Streptomyces sp. NPDC051172 TaxID=3155796 RepID=UPI00342A72CA
MGEPLHIGVLGPLTLIVENTSAAPSAPKLRSVLTTVALHPRKVVPVSTLMGELWDVEPPNSAVTTLQTYVLNLRKVLAASMHRPLTEIAQEVLVTRAGGYMLVVEDDALDYQRYNAMVAAGRDLIAGGDDRGGVALLDEALRMWRGPALVDVQGSWLLESRRLQLEESRLVVLEYLMDAQLRLGMYREALPELVALTGTNPLHEGLHARYMRALHLSGRRAQALKVFQELRGNLVRELGLEPGKPLQRLHQAILSADDALEDAPGTDDFLHTGAFELERDLSAVGLSRRHGQ